MVRVRPLAESINILAGTEGLPLDAAYSAWADRVENGRKAAAKAKKAKATDGAKAKKAKATDGAKAKKDADAKAAAEKAKAEAEAKANEEATK